MKYLMKCVGNPEKGLKGCGKQYYVHHTLRQRERAVNNGWPVRVALHPEEPERFSEMVVWAGVECKECGRNHTSVRILDRTARAMPHIIQGTFSRYASPGLKGKFFSSKAERDQMMDAAGVRPWTDDGELEGELINSSVSRYNLAGEQISGPRKTRAVQKIYDYAIATGPVTASMVVEALGVRAATVMRAFNSYAFVDLGNGRYEAKPRQHKLPAQGPSSPESATKAS